MKSQYSFYYKACPKCGNKKLNRTFHSNEQDFFLSISCPEFKWQEQL